MKKVILASASPRRRELLEQAGMEFEVIVSEADERTEEKNPARLVEVLSERKASAVCEKLCQDVENRKEMCIIGADTVVSVDGEILGKPKNEEDAARMLRKISGRTHQVYTGVTILYVDGGVRGKKVFSECTEVSMYPISDEEIRAYIATGEPLDKAGAYGIQGRAVIFVEKIHGDYSNVVGLPVARLYQELKGGAQ